MRLREYQTSAVRQTRAALANHRAVVLCLATGAGKTVIIAEMVRLAVAKGRRCLINVHRVELVQQTHDKLARFGVEAGIIKAGYPEDRSLPVQVACIPTLVRREMPPAEFVVFDEVHHIRSDSWARVADHYRKQGAWILGTSATPQRLDGKGLGSIFDLIVEPIRIRELIDGGFLLEPVVYAPPSADLHGVRKRGGDYALPELAERMEKLTGSITEYWMRFGKGKPTLAFAVNIHHSEAIRDALLAVGARAVHVDGTSTPTARAAALDGLRNRTVDVVTQVGLWGEGADLPELECLIIARPTMSRGLHLQMCGRVLRPSPGKPAPIILDHAGNTHRHGLITDEVEWSLDDAVRSDRDTVEPVRTCSACYAIVPPDARICPQCGEPVSSREDAEQPGVDNPGVLVLVDPEAPLRATKEERAARYTAILIDASCSGHRLGWARRKFKALFGAWPRLAHLERELYSCPGHSPETVLFGPMQAVRCRNCLLVLPGGGAIQ